MYTFFLTKPEQVDYSIKFMSPYDTWLIALLSFGILILIFYLYKKENSDYHIKIPSKISKILFFSFAVFLIILGLFYDYALYLAVALFIIYIPYNFYIKKKFLSKGLSIKFFLIFLRFALLIIFLLILAEPIWEEKHSKVRKSNVIFMVDNSISMKIKDVYSDRDGDLNKLANSLKLSQGELLKDFPRIDIAKKTILNLNNVKKLEEKADVHFYKFSNNYEKINNVESVEATGLKTNIYDNLLKVVNSFKGRTIAEIFLLTDGQHNTGEQTLNGVSDYCYRLEIPVNPVAIGSNSQKKDINLVAVNAPEIAIVDDNVVFNIKLKHTGYKDEAINIHIKWGDSTIAEKTVTLGEEESQEVKISHIFRLSDDYNLKIEIPSLHDEYTNVNNIKQHNIKVIQQKLKVLYLEGLPRWEYRYLKNALVRDETVIVNTWLFSADENFPQEKSSNAPYISGIPTEKELKEYHCILLGDVDLKDLKEHHIKSFLKFVEEGGGIAFISGVNYNPSQYWDTQLNTLFPVVIDNLRESQKYYVEEKRIKLTSEGVRHPIVQLYDNLEENLNIWENLPVYYWHYPVNKLKPAATAIAKNSKSDDIIMATHTYGKGRVFFTSLDSSWRWRYKVGDTYFYRFWGQVVRYTSMAKLIGKDPQYYIAVDNNQYSLGDIITIELQVINAADSFIKEKEFEVMYSMPSGEHKQKILKVHPNKADTFEGNIIASEVGNYRVWINPTGKRDISTIFSVSAPIAESDQSEFLNENDLKKIAKSTKGKFLRPFELDEYLKNLKPQQEIIPTSSTKEPLWDKYWIFLIILFIFTLEWIIRKLVRML